MKEGVLFLLCFSLLVISKAQNFTLSEPFESVDDSVGICYGETAVFNFDKDALLDQQRVEGYHVAYYEPDPVNDPYNAHDFYKVDWYNDHDSVKFNFRLNIDRECWVYAKLRQGSLFISYSNVIKVSPKGDKPSLVYTDSVFCSGSTLNVSVDSNNYGEGNYKWYNNGNLINGESTSTITLDNSALLNVEARNPNGVCPDAYIASDAKDFKIIQPKLYGELQLDMYRLKLSTDDIYVSYKWYSGQTRDNLLEISGATTANYNVALTDNELYLMLEVETNNGCLAKTDTFLVNNTTYGTPVINQPERTTLCPNDTIVLSVDDLYAGYEWFRDGVSLKKYTPEIRVENNYPYGPGAYTVKVSTVLDQSGILQSESIAIDQIAGPLVYKLTDTAFYCHLIQLFPFPYSLFWPAKHCLWSYPEQIQQFHNLKHRWRYQVLLKNSLNKFLHY